MNFFTRFTYISLCVLCVKAFAQEKQPFIDSASSGNRLPVVLTTTATLFAGSIYALNNQWYKQYPRTSFHFFNDNDEWLQMDKVGHVFSSYQLGRAEVAALRWSGIENKKAVYWGGIYGLLFQSSIEIMDGFSGGWGFSSTDMLTNIAGTGLLIGQEVLWNEQRISIKFSFHQSDLSKYRPELLGRNFSENMLKDYNGQTYWLSGNIHSFLNPENKFPRWLNAAIGYSADGMTGGGGNPFIDGRGMPMPDLLRYRRFLLSVDVDWTKIPTRSKTLQTVFWFLNAVKVPYAALELNKKDGWVFRWLYF